MLPVFPKARAAMQKVSGDEMFAGMWGVCPLLKQIRVRPQTEGREASYQREDGKVVEMQYNLRRVERGVKVEDAKGLSPEEFLEFYSNAGRELGNMMMADLLKGVGDAAEEVGNVIGLEGKGLTFEKYLEMTAKIYTEFDDYGCPRPKSVVLPPELLQKFQKDIREWAADPMKRAAIEEVMQRHRKKFNEIEAGRRMVD
jgi:hypothetical protein